MKKFHLTPILTMVFVSFCSCAIVRRNEVSTPSSKDEVSAVEKKAPHASRSSSLLKNDGQSDVNAKNEFVEGQIHGSSILENQAPPTGEVYFLYGAEHLNLKNYFFDIPVVFNDEVKKWIHYFLNKGKDYFVRYSERAGRYAPILGKILEDHGLPRDLIFLAMAESGFHDQAKSSAQAVGTWQFIPFTGRKYGLKINWYVDERRDPIKSTIAASRYLKDLYSYFGSWELAAAGYNAGEGKLTRAIHKYKTENFWDLRKGRYLKRETKNYLPKIMGLAIIGKNLKSFGLSDIDFHEPLDFDEVEVFGNTDLFKVSEASGIPLEEIQRLNPELLRWVTPPYDESYRLRLPVGSSSKWDSCCSGKTFVATNYMTMTIDHPKTTIKKVALQWKLNPSDLAKLNSVNEGDVLANGSIIKLPFRDNQDPHDPMYADLYEKKKSRRHRSHHKSRVNMSHRFSMRKIDKERGRGALRALEDQGDDAADAEDYKSGGSKGIYIVKKGDTLGRISRKMGVSVQDIIKSNVKLVNLRTIRAGDRLIIR